MMDPGMMGAPMPPAPPADAMAGAAMDPMAGAMPAGPPSPVELVLAALGAWQQERQTEEDVVLAAVMKATSAGLPSGIEGASEGAPFGAPPMGAGAPPMPPAGPEVY